jgi:hypothetical protein
MDPQGGIIPPEMMAFAALRYLEANQKMGAISADTFKNFLKLMEDVNFEILLLKVSIFFTLLILLQSRFERAKLDIKTQDMLEVNMVASI